MLVQHFLQPVSSFFVFFAVLVINRFNGYRFVLDRPARRRPVVALVLDDLGVICDNGRNTVTLDLEGLGLAVELRNVRCRLLGEVLHRGIGCRCHGYYSYWFYFLMQRESYKFNYANKN